jgi:hypothetical protein
LRRLQHFGCGGHRHTAVAHHRGTVCASSAIGVETCSSSNTSTTFPTAELLSLAVSACSEWADIRRTLHSGVLGHDRHAAPVKRLTQALCIDCRHCDMWLWEGTTDRDGVRILGSPLQPFKAQICCVFTSQHTHLSE